MDISHSPPSFLPLLKSSWNCSRFWFGETWTVSQQGSPGQSALWGAGCCSVGSELQVSPTWPKGFPQARSVNPGLKREDARASALRCAFASQLPDYHEVCKVEDPRSPTSQEHESNSWSLQQCQVSPGEGP